MKPIKLGHIGTMHDHSSAKLSCVRKFPDLFEVIGCVAESPEREAEIRDTASYGGVPFTTREALLKQGVEAVLIESHEKSLVHEAQFWADHGVHLHVDKPAGDDVSSLEKLLTTVKKKDLVFQMAYMYRYNHAVLDCMERISKGELGTIYEITAIMNTGHPPQKRQWLNQFEGGIQFFLGCHMIDLIYRLQGMPDKIHSFLKSTKVDGIESCDFSLALFEYPNGISTVEATSAEVNGYGRRQLVVCGSKGTYEIEPLEAPTHAYFISKENASTFADCRKEVSLPPFDPLCRYDEMMKDFARFIRKEKENPYTLSYELALQKLLMYCCGHKDVDWKSPTEI